MRIVFMGTPEFAAESLKALINNKYDICAVFTQPDRAKGRGNKITKSPVKELAESANIPIYQPEKIKTEEYIKILKELKPSLIAVVAYGQLLSQEILDIPPMGCINVHGSLLPKYRGAAPINWCIINGEKTTGITTMYMNKGLDTGDMILKNELQISDTEEFLELYNKMAVLGADTLIRTIELISKNEAPRVPQKDEEATYAPILKKELGKINWSMSAREIYNLIRGTYPWPGTYSSYNGKTFKIIKAEVYNDNTQNKSIGVIEEINKDSIIVTCGVGSIKIIELQFENEKKMSVEAYLRGHNIEKNIMLQ